MGIETVSDIVRVHGVGRAGKTALVQGERTLTWGKLLALYKAGLV